MSYMAPISASDTIMIQPRNRKFSRSALSRRWWLNGDPVATAFYNAMSASFPKGEAFFVEALLKFKDIDDPKLIAEIDAFVKQEAFHAREHIALNRRITEAGYDVTELEAQIERRLMRLRQKSSVACLVATMVIEHLTATFAHELLANSRHMKGADPELVELWRWHCMEEVEHKAVAFDVWMRVTRDWSRWKRWSVRSKVMVFVTRRFVLDRLRGMIQLLRQDGLTGPRVWAAVAWFMFARPGMMRKILSGCPKYFKPGFHPWDDDNRHLIDNVAVSASPL